MAKRRLWSKEELIVTLALYYQLPFGRLNQNTKEVQELAKLLGRTNSSIALRLVNFAACDPYILATGRHGMDSGVTVCKPIWDEYYSKEEKLFVDAEIIKSKILNKSIDNYLHIHEMDYEGKTRESLIKQRVGQQAFRSMIMANYNNTCAISGICVPELLVASHIIPWSAESKERLNPENGICLSSLYDKAFDKGLISIYPDDYTIILSKEIKQYKKYEFYQQQFEIIEHKPIILPDEHLPKKDFLEYHINNIFNIHN